MHKIQATFAGCESSTTISATSSPKRFKRSLPTTISTRERSPRQAKKSKPKSFSCPKKSLNFDQTKTRTTMKQQSLVTALTALNIEELIERSSTQGFHCFSQWQSGNSKLFWWRNPPSSILHVQTWRQLQIWFLSFQTSKSKGISSNQWGVLLPMNLEHIVRIVENQS